MTAVAGSIAVEVVADLSSLETGLNRAQTASSRAANRIAGDLGRVERAAANTNTASGRLAAAYNQMGVGAGTASTASGRLAAANDNVARTASQASTAVKALAGALALINAAALIALGTATAKVGMEMTALQRGFAAASGSAVQGARELTFVKAEADKLGLSLGETARQYMQMLAASQGTAMQGQATRDIFIAVSTAMTALGKSSADAGGALNAVQQMMSKGSVQSEELKGQLGERLPGAFNLAAQAMGKTNSEFQQMLEDGDVLASDLLPKLAQKLMETYGAAAKAGANDLGANLNRLSNAWQELTNAVAQGGFNDALNTATQALKRFVEAGEGAALGRNLGNAIEWLVQALERVPRGFENLQIGLRMIGDLVRAFETWTASMLPAGDALSGLGPLIGSAFSAAVGYVSTAIDGIIGVAVAGYQMVAAAWQALPAVFAQIAKAAGDALIAGIESAVNAIIRGLNAFVNGVNAIGAMLPEAVGFKKLDKFKPVVFERLTTEAERATGAAGKLGDELTRIGKEATSRSYVREFGKAATDAIDGQIGKFRVLRADQDASNHLLREAGKIAQESKVADALNNVAKAGKAAGAGAKDAAGGAKQASSAYENLIQRTKDRIEELELEAKYASRTATEVIKLKLAHDLERAAKKDGTEVTEAMRAEWDKLGGELADAVQNLERVRKAQNDLKKAQDAVADSFKSFVEDVLTGSDGIQGALKSLGKSFLSNSLDALISGKGPLAGITGMAANDNKSQGGILGWLTGIPKAVEKGAEKGSQAGTVDGVVNGLGTFASSGNGTSLFGIDSKQLAGGLSAIAGLAGAYGSGMAASSYGQAVGGGAISGAMAGASLATGLGMAGNMALPGIGLVIGAGLAYYGQQQARKQAREQREREAQENYKNAQPAIATMRSQLRGDPQNTLKIQIAEAEAATRKLTDVMFFAKKYDEERETYLDFKKYEARLLSEYRDGFIGMIQSMEAGLGPNSPFAQAKSAVADFGKELQGFIENAETAFGQGTTQVDQARQASIAYAVSVLDGAKSLTLVQQRMQEIQGTGAGLVKVLVDLGVASEQAGEAVTAGVAMAVQRLRDTFETDLQAKTNEALDKGYLNDARSLLLEIQQLATDSRTLGTDPGNITRYFQAAAQNLVNEANLTGDAFTEFLALFPEFTGNVVAAGQALEDASRRLGYLDRLFAATNDTSTLAGQLAAYDRQAMREREEEIKLGGQYILELEAAQQAERYNIIRDFNKAANDNYRQSLQQAQDYVARFTRSIQEYLDGLRAGSDSPLSPQARLAAAQSQYNAQLVLAQGGDRNALDGITSYASDLIDAAKGFFASSTGFQDIFAQIQSQLGALPSQISAEQFIVNAIEAGADQTVAAVDAMKVTLQSAVSSGSASEIAAALSTYFNRIDSNTSASIDFNEMRSALGGMASDSQLRDMFTRIDTDNSGSISRLEAINTATGQVRASNLNQEISLATANQIAQSVASLNNSINQNIATGNGILYEVRNATNAVNQSSLASSTYSDLIVRNLRSQAQNWGAQNVHGYAIPFFRDGGLIGGRGTGTSDSNLIRASRGEMVFRKAAVDYFGASNLLNMNDNLAMPVMPVPVASGGGDMRAVVAMLGKLIDRVGDLEAALVEAEAEGAALVADRVDGVRAVQMRSNTDMRQMANRPRQAGTNRAA